MTVLKTPIITEKMTADSERNNRYGFIVDRKANKVEIKKAIEEMYGVTVGKVRTMNYVGKPRTRNTKSGVISGRTKPFKKAVVSLSEGDTIDFFSNI
jgi:large subunit ribosomal protein L23|tara:strand:- start:132 stop:422 length:291 start_codon:yes stop_codon:yes gene_type:complete